MYTPAFCWLTVGGLFLIVNLVLFFQDYKQALTSPNEKKQLVINGLLLAFSLAIIVFSIIYLFLINNQLHLD
ncbi:hypothetical protein [Enterococcus faecium]|uniref:hypothetical protein n=1 Tax=Enterococcus faecium TaxID=1352 RepID=UPI0002A237B1|nr:hypothetical protein [Enterococcus faecium]ELA94247.1 hypothetical protein OIA_05102 [Enterococcus faecium EnGen0018]